METIDKVRLHSYLCTMEHEFGAGNAKSLGWFDTASQQCRFRILSLIADLSNKTVLDIGCGYADFAQFLQTKYTNCSYIGVDLSESFINYAKKRYTNKRKIHLILNDYTNIPLPRADYILSSGIFSFQISSTDFYMQQIKRLYQSATCGFGFNMLTPADTKIDNDILQRYNPHEIFRFCNAIAPLSTIICGYLPNDFTVFMYH